MSAVLVLLCDDLRAEDNRALQAAAETGAELALLFVLDPADGVRGAALWWLGEALGDFSRQMEARGLRLFAMRGDRAECAKAALAALSSREVYLNSGVNPARDAALVARLRESGASVHFFSQSLFAEESLSREGGYRVFSAYRRAALGTPLCTPCGTTPPFAGVAELADALPAQGMAAHLEKAWTGRLASYWEPTEAGLAALVSALPEKASDYDHRRDQPFRDGTTRLSPYLRFGQIDAARLHTILSALPASAGREALLRQLVWREFARHVLLHRPGLPAEPLDASFRFLRWRSDAAGLEAWKEGRTGFPIVDAGMRQLWKTGWMHNRVRMICASFLVKDLLVDWREGAAWFMETLVDADEAQNSFNWQWVAGCGCDAAPFFRVFSPALQSSKFDPDGYYVRKFVPELAFVPPEWVHNPLGAPEEVMAEAGLSEETYPMPLVEHSAARLRALDALKYAKAAAKEARA